jgi:DNA repair ATPase RecN
METIMILRSKTDDALELFVKAQMKLAFATEKMNKMQRVYDRRMKKFNRLMRRFPDNYEEMETLSDKIDHYYFLIANIQEDVNALEEECRQTGDDLTNARKIERNYLATIVKNEIVA